MLFRVLLIIVEIDYNNLIITFIKAIYFYI